MRLFQGFLSSFSKIAKKFHLNLIYYIYFKEL